MTDLQWWTDKLQKEIELGKRVEFPADIFTVISLAKACENGYSAVCKAFDNGLLITFHDNGKQVLMPVLVAEAQQTYRLQQ